LVQGTGWPAVADILQNWFTRPEERALWWSLVSVSQNFGAALTPLLVTIFVSPGTLDGVLPTWLLTPQEPWRMGFLLLGGMPLLTSLAVLAFLRDRPGDNGSSNGNASGGTVENSTGNFAKAPPANKPSLSFVGKLQALPAIFAIMVVGDLALYVVRGAFADWSALIFTNDKGLDPLVVPQLVALFEVVGIVGRLVYTFAGPHSTHSSPINFYSMPVYSSQCYL